MMRWVGSAPLLVILLQSSNAPLLADAHRLFRRSGGAAETGPIRGRGAVFLSSGNLDCRKREGDVATADPKVPANQDDCGKVSLKYADGLDLARDLGVAKGGLP